ncbi:Dual specificity phosphatase, catalytic domain containing protein [Trichomonas vaginalis G3]|uniref:protein-tyrosine-phosphatase n=1 Tax=Trichomonas vaginalis (strain ATCC PRA-98 / G3) TaxID=412133 RepID=A2GAH5_TRIV3|nr:protein tyrosine/serine/threonine phosphatase protein [Trichomonas vaginalis G3]EAX85841.1 Dual specificity phosphatase, catalytic domain containing protein [Trichomonas vaginalis G3]KAI5496711.1 protein tyrosine/serine/threonine phosphatase protein [Trichomonas vaginalis G3]|eukprot:XP_001298771.1 Dual specificity phosphatase, catalytic domain containing protein [Trichomonas vaginalis G3]
MGIGLSVDSYLDSKADGAKSILLLQYENEQLQPVPFTEFIENPLAFTTKPLVCLEPTQQSDAPIVSTPVSNRSLTDTMRLFHQHFRIQNFKLQTQYVWMFASNKLPSTTINELMTYLRKAPLQNYTCNAAVAPSSIFSDLGGINSLKFALKPPSPTQRCRASSPLRTAGQMCGANVNLFSRRSHQVGMNATFVLPVITNQGNIEERFPDEMNLVDEGVFVGSERAAANKQALLDNHITHIINLSGNTSKNHFPETFNYFTVKMNDNDFEEIPNEFWEALTYLKKARDEGGIVLVHCRMGYCRSPALVAAYMSDEKKISIDNALSLIQSKRPEVSVNPGFLDQLHLREDKKRKSKPRLLINTVL